MALTFRLFYRGPLPSAGRSKSEFKHALRRELHPQLESAWRTAPVLGDRNPVLEGGKDEHKNLPVCKAVNGIKFVPLASEYLKCFVGVEFLVLRAEAKGAILERGGDIDNRIKTIIDALQIPSPDELSRIASAHATPSPCYCLMDDDRLLTKLSVQVEQLHAPLDQDDAVVIANVSIASTSRAMGNPYTYL